MHLLILSVGFLGASTVDNPPFILIEPSHLNIVEYVKVSAKPNYRRLASIVALNS